MSHLSSSPSPTANRGVCVVSVTYYTDQSDIRFPLAQQLCRLATQKCINLIIVDDSPAEIHAALQQEEGAHVKIFGQSKDHYHGKGGALRQAIHLARSLLEHEGDLNRCAICFTEPEKIDLINHIQNIVKPLLEESADIVVPSRNKVLFQDTYPIEQYHSESFANLHFDSLAKRHEGFNNVNIDWLFGPFSFKASLATSWLDYAGNSWDAQMIPYVRGILNDGWRVRTVEINFMHPIEMKHQEEGDCAWTTKRLHQLNVLFELLGEGELA